MYVCIVQQHFTGLIGTEQQYSQAIAGSGSTDNLLIIAEWMNVGVT